MAAQELLVRKTQREQQLLQHTHAVRIVHVSPLWPRMDRREVLPVDARGFLVASPRGAIVDLEAPIRRRMHGDILVEGECLGHGIAAATTRATAIDEAEARAPRVHAGIGGV